MSKKPAKTELSPELKALEQKVDAMMDAKMPAKAAVTKKTSTLKVVSDYAGNPQTAPELSPKSSKTAKPSKTVTPEPEAPPEPEAETETPALPTESPESIIEDPDTDQAVADIVIREGDTQLAVEDAIARRKSGEAESPSGPTISGYWVLLFFIVVIGTAAVVYLWFR